eukprot:Rmarinus@m.2093
MLSKEEIVGAHEAMRKNLLQQSGYRSIISLTSETKPSLPRVDLSSLNPIHVISLVSDTTHRGKVLRGKLIVDPLVISCIATILEDDNGDVVRLALYDFLPRGANATQKWQTAQSLFAKGTEISVIEPFFKNAADGGTIVRVERKEDIVIGPRGPDTPVEWKEEATKLFQAQQFREAGRCYAKAIQSDSSTQPISRIMCNIAAVLYQQGDHVRALHAALASRVLDPGFAKSDLRAAAALGQIGGPDVLPAASVLCRRAQEGGANVGNMMTTLRSKAKKRKGFSVNDANEVVLRTLCKNATSLVSRVAIDTQNRKVDVVAQKDKGNNFFIAGRLSDALDTYMNVIGSAAAVSLAVMLANRAACSLQLEEPVEAALFALASLALHPTYARAVLRLVGALLELDMLDLAEVVLSAAPADPLLAPMCDRIRLTRAGAPPVGSSTVDDREPSFEEDGAMAPDREIRKLALAEPQDVTARTSGKRSRRGKGRKQRGSGGGSGDGTSAVSIVSHNDGQQAGDIASDTIGYDVMGCGAGTMFDMLHLCLSSEMRGQADRLSDQRAEPFHTEFRKHEGLPAGCDARACMQNLSDAYQHVRVIPLHEKMMCDTKQELDKMLILQRVGQKDRLMWWADAPLGEVKLFPPPPYSSNMHHSFSNAERLPLPLVRGKTHVSVGFVDLGELLAPTLQGERGAIRWVGYEVSSYAVAKSRVVLAMLQGKAPVDAILQVWFSAAWSTSTLHAFRKAVSKVFEKETEPQVALWLRHWLPLDVPLGRARRMWLDTRGHVPLGIANCKEVADRLALCRYHMTGQLLEGAVGSVVMFGLPPKSGEVALDEHILEVFTHQDLLGARRGASDFISAATELLRERIRALQNRVRGGEVRIEIRLGAVEPSAKPVLRTIRDLRPHSMNWSNLCDYYDASRFHAMAKHCGPSAIHYGHAINWLRDVKGAFLIDYERGNWKSILANAKVALTQVMENLGEATYLHTPPFCHPNDVLTAMASVSQYRQLWTDAWREEGGDVRAEARPADYIPFAHMSGMLHLKFTYDDSVSLFEESG